MAGGKGRSFLLQGDGESYSLTNAGNSRTKRESRRKELELSQLKARVDELLRERQDLQRQQDLLGK